MLNAGMGRLETLEHGVRELYNTEHVDTRDAFEYVRDALAHSPAPLALAGGRPVLLRAISQVAGFGPVTVSIIRSKSDTEFALRRTSTMIRRSDPEAFRLVMAPEGRLRHNHQPGLLRLKERDLALYDTSREFESWRRPGLQPSHLVMITVPRSLVQRPYQQVHSFLGKALPRGLRLHSIAGRLLAEIGANPRNFETLCPQMVSDTLVGLVDGLIADLIKVPVPSDVAHRARLLLAQAVIAKRARNPSFTTADIAKYLNESERTLRNSARLCETPLNQLVTEYRVSLAAREIADPAHIGQSLKIIAARCGFNRHEVMTRAIGEYLGRTPSSLRPMGIAPGTETVAGNGDLEGRA